MFVNRTKCTKGQMLIVFVILVELLNMFVQLFCRNNVVNLSYQCYVKLMDDLADVACAPARGERDASRISAAA